MVHISAVRRYHVPWQACPARRLAVHPPGPAPAAANTGRNETSVRGAMTHGAAGLHVGVGMRVEGDPHPDIRYQQLLYVVCCPLPQLPHGGRRSLASSRLTDDPQFVQQ